MSPTGQTPADLLIGLAQTQLLAQMLDSDNVDGRSMGVLGFNGALTAGNIAAKDVFGRLWWLPLLGFAASSFILLALRRGLRLVFGPEPSLFYATHGGLSTAAARRQLLSDLDHAVHKNSPILERKERRLAAAVILLLLTLVYSTAVFA